MCQTSVASQSSKSAPMMEKENKSTNDNGRKPSGRDLQSLPTRQYLDQTVNPILLQGLKVPPRSSTPQDPIQYLANYLLADQKPRGGQAMARRRADYAWRGCGINNKSHELIGDA
ncbi:hypothetical protein pipiens_001766 [Culex pipiens pipiens]|uniref:Uncharacterized protein n=1 Tax=Culex pipiens pipiens TaxID=38569 RepID=A0ABD1DVD3_CULPP